MIGPDWLAAALPVIGAVVLVRTNEDAVRGTWTGRWGCSPVSWTLWALLGWVAVAAQAAVGGGATLWLLVVITVICTAIAAGALRMRWLAHRGRDVPVIDAPDWQVWVDALCAIGGVVALVVLLTSSGETALWLTLGTDAIAALPTLTAAWHRPHGQPLAPFVGGTISASCTLAALPYWSFITAGYSIYLWLLSATLTVVITFRRAAEEWLAEATRLDAASEAATEELVPPWARCPHSAALRELIPAELFDCYEVPAPVVVELVERAYTQGHLDGAEIRPRLRNGHPLRRRDVSPARPVWEELPPVRPR